jgi:outer membrane lipoprotein-sorting protein
MTIAKLTISRALAVGLLVTASSGRVLAGAEFSAEMVQHGPQGEMSSGKMFVGNKRMRTEMSHQGQQVIRITDENRGVEWVLFPEQKKYMEQKLAEPGGKAGGGAKPKPAEDPCGGMPGLTCRKLGEEDIGGRTAVKWEMVASRQGQTMKSTQWIDKERGVPLRQEMPNGQTTELKFIGKEDIGGRQVEKWEMVATMPNQPETRTFQWLDPELEMAVRQEFPGGMVSELTDIRVGKQPDELFNIPAGYERMSAPQGMPGGPQGEPAKN